MDKEKKKARKRALAKLTADTLQKLGIGSVLIGLFQAKPFALVLSVGFLLGSYIITMWEASV